VKKLFQLRIDQWLLFGVLIAVALLFIAKIFLGGGEQQASDVSKGKGPSKLLMEQYEDFGKKWETPDPLVLKQHKIFVSRLIVLSPKTGNIEWLDPDKPMDDGITAAWKLRYGFSIEDPNLGSQDPDNDGFTIKEEYDAGTDPTDAKSRPSILVKLKMVKFTYVPFRIQFKAANRLPDGSLQFQLNLLDVAQKKTRFVKTGDDFEGYKVGEYREKIVEEERGGVKYKVDRSELDLTNVKLNEIVTLVLNTQKESDESHVTFKVNVPDAKLNPSDVQRGDTFKLIYKNEGQPAEMEFQLLKGSAEGATIKNMKTGEVLEVGVQK
jgi:hypothetical protein